MRYTRERHAQFLEEELQKQVDDFKKELETSARFLLLEKNTLFLGTFISFRDSGDMVLKMPRTRPLPRKGDYLYALVLPAERSRYKTWGDITYGTLVKEKAQASEVHLVWVSSCDDERFMLAGFKGVSVDMEEFLSKHPKATLALGPQVPPYEYLANLEKIVENSAAPEACEILDADYESHDFTAISLNSAEPEIDIPDIIISRCEKEHHIIIQGPPGTGKTFQIAEICRRLCEKNKSVLVTALTNRALMEVALQKQLNPMVEDKRVLKTNLTADEKRERPGLVNSAIVASPGKVMLATFYMSSHTAANITEDATFDYVIMDEASQAFLAMFSASVLLGSHTIWVGDICQMPPVVTINEDRIKRQHYEDFVDGMRALCKLGRYTNFLMVASRRLLERGTSFTGIFYDEKLKAIETDRRSEEYKACISSKDGPIWMPVAMQPGDTRPSAAIDTVITHIRRIKEVDKDLNIAVYTQLVETVKAIQTAINAAFGPGNDIMVETVARIQGITRDVVFFVIPQCNARIYSYRKRFFNVATSRARLNTFIITEPDVLSYTFMDPLVHEYLRRMIEDSDRGLR